MKLNESQQLLIAVGILVLAGIAHFFQSGNATWLNILLLFVGVVSRALGSNNDTINDVAKAQAIHQETNREVIGRLEARNQELEKQLAEVLAKISTKKIVAVGEGS